MNDLHEIKNVEIFAAGMHNGDRYDIDDLDDMVHAFHTQGFTPAVKAGHSDKPGTPALGWVENLRRVGDKLLADLTHLPREIYEVVRRRGYDRVSAEIYWNLQTGGKTFRRALKALALLGAEPPAITSLAPLHTLFSQHQGELKVYVVDVGNDPSDETLRLMATPPNTARHLGGNYVMKEKLKQMSLEDARATAGEILDSKAKLLQQAERGLNYSEALARVAKDSENDFLMELYTGVGASDDALQVPGGEELDRKTRALMDKTGERDYAAACRLVLSQDSDLARRYNHG